MRKNHGQLTPRQWALYRFLKEQGDQWTKQITVAEKIYETSGKHYGDSGKHYDSFHDSPARMQMTADIRAINDSDVIQKVIISSSKGVKIANGAEFERYIRKEIGAAIRKLLRAKRKAAKGKLNGQMRFVFNSEQETVKSFIDSDKATGERLLTARKAQGMTAHEVTVILRADGFPVDAPMLSRFEHGYCLPNKKTLAKLAEIYGVEPSELVQVDLSASAIFDAI